MYKVGGWGRPASISGEGGALSVSPVLECVVNVSEGRDAGLVARLAEAGGPYVLDVHTDFDHNRSVLTMCGPAPGAGSAVEEAVRAVATATVDGLDLRTHSGAHPRIGALDVVPFVFLDRDEEHRLVDGAPGVSRAARDCFAAWAGTTLQLPCFLYGPERTLPDLRREAWVRLPPDHGPPVPHPSAGAAAVGTRRLLVAYNLWLSEGCTIDRARSVASLIRGPGLRTLGLEVGDRVQVSCNLVDPLRIGPGAAFDAVARQLELPEPAGPDEPEPVEAGIERAELVGLLPAGVLEVEPHHRWAELGLDPGQTIEARLEQAGLDGGSFCRPAGALPLAEKAVRLAGGHDAAALQRPAPADLAALPLAESAPDPEFLTVGEGVLQAVLTDHAAPAHFLGLPRGGSTLGEEEIRVDPHAVGLALPGTVRGTE